MGGELRAVVGSDMVRRAKLDEELGQTVQYIVRVQSSIDDDGHTSPGELIDHGEHTELPSIVGSVHDEVIGPDMIGPARPQTDAGLVIEP